MRKGPNACSFALLWRRLWRRARWRTEKTTRGSGVPRMASNTCVVLSALPILRRCENGGALGQMPAACSAARTPTALHCASLRRWSATPSGRARSPLRSPLRCPPSHWRKAACCRWLSWQARGGSANASSCGPLPGPRRVPVRAGLRAFWRRGTTVCGCVLPCSTQTTRRNLRLGPRPPTWLSVKTLGCLDLPRVSLSSGMFPGQRPWCVLARRTNAV
mmetsp:Transcript_9252/g.25914  ORF Transcript_9252/g.25914 Transcript_9252/m.25914 type:complete len:218 (-) Transcript_9252:651-1304(-)